MRSLKPSIAPAALVLAPSLWPSIFGSLDMRIARLTPLPGPLAGYALPPTRPGDGNLAEALSKAPERQDAAHDAAMVVDKPP